MQHDSVCYDFRLPCGCTFTYDASEDDGFGQVCMASCQSPNVSALIGSGPKVSEAEFQQRVTVIGHQTETNIFFHVEWK